MKLLGAAAVILALAALPAGAGQARAAEPQSRFVLASPAFRAGGLIPKVYTCDGAQRIVPLRWSGVPRGTHSFALLVQDPDAPSGTFTHRVAWGIGAGIRSLGRSAPREGTTSAGRTGWVGPCPPSGAHRYVFRLYALRSPLPLRGGADLPAFLAALKGRVLGTAVLIGRYAR